jgi:predicted PurR-regulated permease PerM
MTLTPPPRPSPDYGDLLMRVLVAGGVVCGALLIWRLRDALAIGLGSIVLALGFRGLAETIGRRARLPTGVALALVIGLCLGAVALSAEVFGATLAAQFGELSRKLPESLTHLAERMDRTPLGHELLVEGRTSLATAITAIAPKLAADGLAKLGLGLTYFLVMVAGGVFLALDPRRYHDGALALIPQARRARYARLLSTLADALRRWLQGRMVVMVAVGVMSSLGLWLLGIDAPIALGLTGAVLTFIPNLGSVMAALPAMLIAFLQEPIKAVAVAAMIWAVHFVEGTFITPYVQDEAVDVPPVMSIFSTIVFALLLGTAGVLLVGPITVVMLVLVRELYITDGLGEAPRAMRGRLKVLGKARRKP